VPGKVIELSPAGSARNERHHKQVATLVEDRISRLISEVSTEQLLALLALMEAWEEVEEATLPLSAPCGKESAMRKINGKPVRLC
jgi:hypothetical protein